MYWFIIPFIFLVFIRCHKADDPLEEALAQAGGNRPELEEVLIHYQTTDADPEKYRVASFLIENMQGKFSYRGEKYKEFLGFVDSLSSVEQNPDNWEKAFKAYRAQNGTLVGNPGKVHDLTNIKADLLINNIDKSFMVYRTAGWCRDISFDDFCEYILPYRIGTEPLGDFREKPLEQFRHLMNHRGLSISQVADSILKVTSQEEVKVRTNLGFYPDFPFDMLSRLKVGTCHEFSSLAIMTMRSLGIPVAEDFTPQWPHRGLGHSWAALLASPDSCTDFEGSNSSKVGGHLQTPSFRMAKAYRKTYSRQENSLALNHGGEEVPAFFLNPYIKDVTSMYLDGMDIEIDFTETVIAPKYAYLCVFDNQNWVPIHWAETKDNQAIFTDMGKQVVYLPALYRDRQLIPLTPPILVDKQGNITELVPNKESLHTIRLKRKYPVFDWWNTRTEAMRGGRFQAANRPDFSDARDVYTIDYVPEMTYQDAKLDLDRSFRYWRYVAPDSSEGGIAEIELYGESGELLKGKTMGTEAVKAEVSKEMAFDGDVLTYFQGDSLYGNWVGMDFGRSERVTKIRFLCWNDDNFIRGNELYELYYWEDGKWNSLGQQTGTDSQELVYRNVPKGALLLLSNHTKGREERIFTYENGKQVWW